MGFVANFTAIAFLLIIWPCQVLAEYQDHLPDIQSNTIK